MTKRRNRRLGPSTRAIHLGYEPEEAHGALTPPVYMTSTYAFESAEHGAALFAGAREGYVYGRTRNPTQALLETRIADLEGAESGLAVASGMAAISSTFWALLKAGDRVVADRILYGNSHAFLARGLPKFGVAVDFVDFTEPDTVAEALRKGARAVYFETPANPNLRVIDIGAVAGLARAAGALTIVDNTFATPLLQRPIEHGADLVIHSATKYLGGHGDLLAGIVAGPLALTEEIRLHGLRYLTGGAIAPLTAFLVLRGLKTLELRMERHCTSAQRIASFLAGHDAVARVYYPGLPDSPGHAIAKRQMSAGGGLVAFELESGLEGGRRLIDAVSLIRRAVSLGDAETLIQHPASMTHAAYGREARQRYGIGDGLLRLSVGLENVEDILDDLDAALHSVVSPV